MLNIINIDNCLGCSACKSICPQQCITMLPNEEGFLQPNVNKEKCTNCNMCAKVCPAIHVDDLQSIKNIYYGWHKDENIRKNSSSGGAFSAIAEKVLTNNGVVFGAVYDNNLKKVIHTSSENMDFTKQRKSKYVESDLLDTFSETKQFLENNRQVLFSGTPCQIHGLIKYLGKQYDNLITCDILCHGVPSMKIFNDHLKLFQKKYKKEIIDIDFRPKTYGWAIQALKITFNNGKKRTIPIQQDYFLQGFFVNNLFFRKSCYSCKFRKNHVADIILGDFWGIDKYDPGMNDGKGVSLIFTNSVKGQNVIEQIDNSFTSYPLEYKHATYCFKDRNLAIYNLEKRNKFFNKYLAHNYEKSIKEFIHIIKPIAIFKFIARRIVNKFPIVSG